MTHCLSPLCDHAEEHLLFHKNLLARVRDPLLMQLCDVDVYIHGKRFPCHKAVLCGASEFFRCMLTSAWSESGKDKLHVSIISAAAFEVLLDFIYTGRLSPGPDIVMEVYAAAKLLLMDALDEILHSRVLLHISPASVFDIGTQAYMFDDKDVQEACENFICEHFGAVSKTESFLHQHLECILHFIASDRLFLPEGEVQLAAAVLRWLQHRPSERIESLPTLLKHIRFSELSKSELQGIKNSVPPESPIFDQLCLVLERVHKDPEDHRRPAQDEARPPTPRLEDEIEASEPIRLALESASLSAPSRTSRRYRDGRLPEDSGGPRFRIRRRCVRNIRFDFVVPGYSRYDRGAEALNSPWHKCGGGLLWRLEVYPRGTTSGQDEYLSVFLRCCDESSTDPFSSVANFSLYVVEQNFGRQAAVFRATKTFTNEASCWGKAKYIKLDELMSAEQALRDDASDSLVLGASVTW
jgi:BTB/POZ domain/BTB And C-terminal Kelch/MATH domain